MAKAKASPESMTIAAADLAGEIKYIEPPKPQFPKVLKFQLGLPTDILGSKVTFATSRNLTLEATQLGIVMRSKESRRKIMVSWANVKAAEFEWDGA